MRLGLGSGFGHGTRAQVLSALLGLSLSWVCSPGHCATQATSRASALAWAIQAQAGDGSLVDLAGDQAQPTALFLDSMTGSGITYGYVVGAASSWLSNRTHVGSVDAMARQIIALGHMGSNVVPSTGPLMAAHSSAETGSGGVLLWGPYPGYAATALDTALAYEALVSAGDTLNTLNLQAAMNDLQRADGGWSRGSISTENSAVLPTLAALHALCVYALKNPSKAATASTVVNSGLTWLLARQKSDGGFADDANSSGTFSAATPSQVLETAQAWSVIYLAKRAGYTAATSTAAASVLSSTQNWLVSKQALDGSWNEDALETASVLDAWGTTGDSSATLTDSNHSGIPDVAQAILYAAGSPLASARGLPKGNGNPLAVNNTADTPTLPPWGVFAEGGALLAVAMRWAAKIRRKQAT